MPADPKRIKNLFVAALELPDIAARQAFLESECAGDPDLRQRLNVLLHAHDAPASVLNRPLAEIVPDHHESTAPVQDLEGAGTIIANRYELIEPIGEGGMGTVWMAQQCEPIKRLVAIKLIKAGMDSKQVLARFDAERQALALMDHPNIAKVFDAGSTGSSEPSTLVSGSPLPLTNVRGSDRPYFVMELVKGVPITKYCDEHHLTPRQRLELFIPMCQAIQHAHQKGIIHRDIKPSNVLVAMYDNRPVPKVIDFGVAKATGVQLTEETLHTNFGAVVGTIEYMSPEQASFNQVDVDTRSDIYSLGVLLYELLAGSPPFTRKELEKVGMMEMLRVIREQEPSKPSTKLSSSDALPSLSANRGTEPSRLTKLVRGELDWIVMKSLEKDRNRRYETANSLAMDVQRYLADEPVQACPPSSGYRLRKFVRRNKRPVVAISIMFLLLFAGIVGTTFGLFRAENQRVRAVSAEGDAITQRDKALSSANAARQAALEASESEADTKAFSEFLVNDVLSAARPAGIRGGLGIQVTVRQALEAAQEKIAARFQGRPRAEAIARHDLGVTFRLIGEPQKAEPHLRRALALRQHVLGKDHEVTLISQNSLGLLLHHLDNLDEALPLLEEVFRERTEKLGPDHEYTLNTMVNLASVYEDDGKLDLALPLYEEALRRRTAKFGPRHSDTLNSMAHLASGHQAAGKPGLALPLFEKAHELSREVRGPDHPNTLATMGNLGGCYRRLERFDLAIPLLERTLELQTTMLGRSYPDTIVSMLNLASCYFSTRKMDLALPLFEEALRYRRAALGSSHRWTIDNVVVLAECYLALKKPDLALPLCEEALPHRKSRRGLDHPDTLSCASDLGQAYLGQGKLEMALPLLLEAAVGVEKQQFVHERTRDIVWALINCYQRLQQFEQSEAWQIKWFTLRKLKFERGSPMSAYELALLANNLLLKKKFADAEPLLRECLDLRTKNWPDEWTTFSAKSLLGAALLGQKKYTEAEPLLLQGYEGMKQREAKIPLEARALRLRDAVGRLVELYEVWDKKDEALKWQKELDAQKKAAIETVKPKDK